MCVCVLISDIEDLRCFKINFIVKRINVSRINFIKDGKTHTRIHTPIYIPTFYKIYSFNISLFAIKS